MHKVKAEGNWWGGREGRVCTKEGLYQRGGSVPKGGSKEIDTRVIPALAFEACQHGFGSQRREENKVAFDLRCMKNKGFENKGSERE